MTFLTLIHIAWRNFCQRFLGSFLTTLSVALGVGLVVSVMAIYGIVSEAFERNASVGYNLVVGPRGGSLQLVLNSVFYLSKPIENVPYSYYMEFMSQEQREELVAKYGGPPELAERKGIYGDFIGGGFVIPLALGDYYGKYRVVGTTPDFFEVLRYGSELDRKFTFREGEAFQEWDAQHGFFGAVLGSRVADDYDVHVGETFNPNHGDPEGKGHDRGFIVVGVLDPTGTPNDRAAFVNLEGFYLLNDHAKPLPPGESDPPATLPNPDIEQAAKENRPALTPLTIREREVTAMLIRPEEPMFAVGLQNRIKEGLKYEAAAPVEEIANLLQFISPLLTVLLVITAITTIVAANGILVSIYNSMNERRRDIAIMRALGARRDTVTTIILIESVIIAVLGGFGGWLLAHLGIFSASAYIEKYTGVQVSLFSVSEAEFWVAGFVIGLALIAGMVPAIMAYRTDVTKNLAA